MRTKKEILEKFETQIDTYNEIVLEVLIDIRDALVQISEEVKKPNKKGSGPR